MRTFIFIYFLTGLFCLASSCGDRKVSEEQVTSTSSADSVSPEENITNASSENLEQDTLKNNLSGKSTSMDNDVSATTEYSGSGQNQQADEKTEADEETEFDDLSETVEKNTNNNESLEEKEKLKGIKQEQFATVPPELSGRIVLHELPSKTAVGIRSYPNSYVIKLNNKTKYRDKFYVTMELASSDTPEQVLDFYKNRRENWFYIESSAVHTFKKDEDKYFRETNTLQILPFNKNMYREIDSLLSFDAQTLIRIYYELPPQ